MAALELYEIAADAAVLAWPRLIIIIASHVSGIEILLGGDVGEGEGETRHFSSSSSFSSSSGEEK